MSLHAIGNFIGVVSRVDERNFDGSMRLFYQIRVSIDVHKPLKKGMKLKKENGDWIRVEFHYERLLTFCFMCGVLGHGDKYSPN